ncbi:unnamed protein product [Paramecium primaurelia]|uniref:Uncharacterized protein n=1 Tax=Paramecium primaurelia TaxID=5886 RepID=A0A8S1LN07_PARPR|nr:unnamed protein product [Paramecium primaurelia]
MSENNKKSVIIVKQNQKEEEEEESESESESSHCFVNFVNSYSRFINEQSDTCLEMGSVLNELNESITNTKPPQGTVEELQQILEITPQQINELAQQLKQLPDSKIYQCIQNIEKLNLKLQLDLNVEMEKAKANGLI